MQCYSQTLVSNHLHAAGTSANSQVFKVNMVLFCWVFFLLSTTATCQTWSRPVILLSNRFCTVGKCYKTKTNCLFTFCSFLFTISLYFLCKLIVLLVQLPCIVRIKVQITSNNFPYERNSPLITSHLELVLTQRHESKQGLAIYMCMIHTSWSTCLPFTRAYQLFLPSRDSTYVPQLETDDFDSKPSFNPITLLFQTNVDTKERPIKGIEYQLKSLQT